MSSQAVRTLVDALHKLAPDPDLIPQHIWGKIIAVTSTTVTVELNGSSVQIPGVRHSAAYSPSVNDVVYGRRVGTDLLIEGKLA